MKLNIDEIHAKVPAIHDKRLSQAVHTAIALIVGSNVPLAGAINRASDKSGYKPKTHIKVHVRNAIPQAFFDDRARAKRGMAAKRPINGAAKMERDALEFMGVEQ